MYVEFICKENINFVALTLNTGLLEMNVLVVQVYYEKQQQKSK